MDLQNYVNGKWGFTGSLEVGKLIMKNGADTLKRVTLELGGKSPNIVFADADFEHAIQGTCDGIFGNQARSVRPALGCSSSARSTTTRSSRWSLAAAIWTRDIGKALRTAKAMRAGTVWINDSQPAPTEAPWGGYKESGIGRELGPHGIEDYLETKHIYINIER